MSIEMNLFFYSTGYRFDCIMKYNDHLNRTYPDPEDPLSLEVSIFAKASTRQDGGQARLFVRFMLLQLILSQNTPPINP
jgi:hypothetical protein